MEDKCINARPDPTSVLKKENGDAIRKMEKDLKEDMGRITERIDKYVSKKP